MKLLNHLYLALFLSALLSCSHIGEHLSRTPASPPAAKSAPCHSIMGRFLEKGYDSKIQKALESKKITDFKGGELTIRKPKTSLFTKLFEKGERFFGRIINDNRYPAYYIFDERESVPKIIAYVRSYAKIGGKSSARNAQKDFGKEIEGWLKNYENYEQELQELIKTRISLSYNQNLLKHYATDAPDVDRVKLSFYKNGDFEESVFTFRSDDENLTILMRDIENEIRRFDGDLFSRQPRENTRLDFGIVTEGVIRNRVLEQAKLKDRLTILHREVEFAHFNLEKRSEFEGHTEEGKKAIQELYQRLNVLLESQDSRPSNWAIQRTAAKKFWNEMKHSIKSNKRIEQMREKSEVIKEYLSEHEITRAQLLSRRFGTLTRFTFFATPGAMTVSGLVTMFDLDEKIADIYENYLIWRYGNKISCVRQTSDKGYLDCLYKHYETEYPDIIKLALKNPDFNPWDLQALRNQGSLAANIVDSYILDIKEMQKFREYYRYIQKRRQEIKDLFAEQHQIIIDGVVDQPTNLATCVTVPRDQLPACLFDSVFSRLTASSGKIDYGFDRQNFPYNELHSIPQDIRQDYKRELEDILFQRSIYSDLNELEDYQIRIFLKD